MPADSTATSVPAPMAMPTSAVASAGASLTPSPTIATLPAALLEAPDGGRLVGRQHLRGNLVDAESARDRIGDGLAVAGDHRHADPQRVEASTASRRLRPDLVLQGEGRRRPARRHDVEHRPALRAAQPSRRREIGGIDVGRARSSRRGPPIATSRPSTVAPDAAPGQRLEAGRPRVARRRALRGRRRSPGPAGARSRASTAAASASIVVDAAPSATTGRRATGVAHRQRAGLVEDDHVELAGPLEGDPVLHQQAVARAERGRDRDDQRDREAQRVGAGDDEHGRRADAARPRGRRAATRRRA